MTCDLPTLTAQACASGFFGQSPQDALAIKLQLLKTAAGDSSTLSQLISAACASGFMFQSKTSAKAIELQLLCNAGGG